MSDRTQEEGRFYMTEKDYVFTPLNPDDVVRTNRDWEAGLLAATRWGDPTYPPGPNKPPAPVSLLKPTLTMTDHTPIEAVYGELFPSYVIRGVITNYTISPDFTFPEPTIGTTERGMHISTYIDEAGDFQLLSPESFRHNDAGSFSVDVVSKCVATVGADEEVTTVPYLVNVVMIPDQPVVSFTTPANNATVDGANRAATMVVNGTVGSQMPTATYETALTVNGTPTSPAVDLSAKTWTATVPSASLVMGENTLVFTSKAVAGTKKSTEASSTTKFTYRVKPVVPTFTLTSGSDYDMDGAAEPVFTVKVPLLVGETLKSATATINSKTTSVTIAGDTATITGAKADMNIGENTLKVTATVDCFGLFTAGTSADITVTATGRNLHKLANNFRQTLNSAIRQYI